MLVLDLYDIPILQNATHNKSIACIPPKAVYMSLELASMDLPAEQRNRVKEL